MKGSNKMTLSQEYILNSEGLELRSGPRPLLPMSGCTNFISQASPSNVSLTYCLFVCLFIFVWNLS